MYDDLWNVIRSIPAGRVASYGAVGRALRYPASGFLVGRWMASCPDDIPWWRVVAKNGKLPVWKKDPNAERLQIELLEREGVSVDGSRVDMDRFSWTPA